MLATADENTNSVALTFFERKAPFYERQTIYIPKEHFYKIFITKQTCTDKGSLELIMHTVSDDHIPFKIVRLTDEEENIQFWETQFQQIKWQSPFEDMQERFMNGDLMTGDRLVISTDKRLFIYSV